MRFLPLDRMAERVKTAKTDSDSLFFENLLYYGEMVTKMTTLGLASAIADDRQRQRYRIVHKLVRAEGIGEWGETIGDILKGPSAEHLMEEARDEQQQLTQRVAAGSWQHKAATLLHECLRTIDNATEALPVRVDGLRWFALFAQIRNKSRGHGALLSHVHRDLCAPLDESIDLFVGNYRLFTRPWAYLYRNLSGKYRVTPYTEPSNAFAYLKSSSSVELPALDEGVYIHFGGSKPCRVPLIHSTVDANDFFLPNGSFKSTGFELLSYTSGDIRTGDATLYLTPASDLPPSETQGMGQLGIQGSSFGNIPPIQTGYIRRTTLESKLYETLKDDHHPIITLSGRGGIGKTWLALTVLHRLAGEGVFEAIVWFSARDIDLLASGPKTVAPHVLTETDMAKEFVRLMEPAEADEKAFRALDYFAGALTKSPMDRPFLFVFDNFETVRSPAELFARLDTHVRNPNKILITTRVREFKADYPVNVSGMSESECLELINLTARSLGITHLLNPSYATELINESEGHPYVIKVLLGEVAKAGKRTNVEHIVASREEILDALFERTYGNLTPAAKRVFLTLCGWRSTVAQLAIEAVLLRQEKERIDVVGAVEELRKSSFVEVTEAEKDGQLFISVPLVASFFGRRKLEVSPMKSAIQADMPLLLAFGAAQASATGQGLLPRLNKLFRNVAREVSQNPDKLHDHVPMLEFLARNYPPAWKLLASLYEESSLKDRVALAKEALRRYLETAPSIKERLETWRKIVGLCQQSLDVQGEIQALVEMSQLAGTEFSDISNAANRLNQLFRDRYLVVDSSERSVLIEQLASVMESRIGEGNATDCSRLAWLFLNAHDQQRARQYAEKGLELEPGNIHCANLGDRLRRDADFRGAQ